MTSIDDNSYSTVIAVGKGNEECIDLDWFEWATYTQLLIK
jgi:hypothetical protein